MTVWDPKIKAVISTGGHDFDLHRNDTNDKFAGKVNKIWPLFPGFVQETM